jgi:hypothetical protein
MSDSIGVAVAEDEHGIGKAVVVGVVGGTIAIFLLVALGVWGITGSFGGGAVMGAFCALWGGPGFGIMAGSAGHALQAERRPVVTVPASTAAPTSTVTDTVSGAGRETGMRPAQIPDSLSA